MTNNQLNLLYFLHHKLNLLNQKIVSLFANHFDWSEVCSTQLKTNLIASSARLAWSNQVRQPADTTLRGRDAHIHRSTGSACVCVSPCRMWTGCFGIGPEICNPNCRRSTTLFICIYSIDLYLPSRCHSERGTSEESGWTTQKQQHWC